jgi:hypothetical protein
MSVHKKDMSAPLNMCVLPTKVARRGHQREADA